MAEAGVQAVLNESALRRVDPYVHQVLDVAKYVAVYSFDQNNWHKTGIEGSLFLYARTAEPLFNLLVLNRLNKNNLIEPVTPQMDIQLKEEFLLYKNTKGNIYGVWFFEKDDCKRITALIQKVMSNSTTGYKPQVVTVQNNTQNVDIFKMLTMAQEAYTTSKDSIPIPNRKQSPLEMDGTPHSVAEFFAKAGSAPQSNNLPIERTKTAPESESAPIFIQKLMSNPVHSVEHIEKQQRVVTPHSADPSKHILNPMTQIGGMVASDFFRNPPIDNGQQRRPRSEVYPTTSQPPGFVFHDGSVGGSDSMTSFSSNRNGDEEKVMTLNYTGSNSQLNHPHTPVQSINDEFKTLKLDNVKNGLANKNVSLPPGFGNAEDRKPDLMPPAMFAPRAPLILPPPPEPLTRNQLSQALSYLLRNDPDFMNKIHEAYVKSLTDKIQ